MSSPSWSWLASISPFSNQNANQTPSNHSHTDLIPSSTATSLATQSNRLNFPSASSSSSTLSRPARMSTDPMDSSDLSAPIPTDSAPVSSFLSFNYFSLSIVLGILSVSSLTYYLYNSYQRTRARAREEAEARAANKKAVAPLLQEISQKSKLVAPFQSLQWFTDSLEKDEEGDLAHEFISVDGTGKGAIRRRNGQKIEEIEKKSADVLKEIVQDPASVRYGSTLGKRMIHSKESNAAAAPINNKNTKK